MIEFLNLTVMSNSSSVNEGVLAILAFPFVAAGGFYYAMYRRYRNHDKHYQYEQNTDIKVFNMQQSDVKIDSVRGVSNKKIKGDNSNSHRTRVQRF